MKRVIGILTAFGLLAHFGSCKKPINCTTPTISKVIFYSTISTFVVPDSSVTLTKFRKNSNFSQIAQIYPNIRMSVIDYNKRMDFPDKGVDVYDYDWQIVMHPSNKMYYIRGLSHLSATSTTSDCTNTVSYYVNDSLITVPGNPYSIVPNFVSDIEIKYY